VSSRAHSQGTRSSPSAPTVDFRTSSLAGGDIPFSFSARLKPLGRCLHEDAAPRNGEGCKASEGCQGLEAWGTGEGNGERIALQDW
jgi:hypothetical protein